MIATFRTGITGEAESRGAQEPETQATGAQDSFDLRTVLFDPLTPAFGGRKRLLLAPDGNLSRLPFEVLPTADGRRVIDEYQISYLGAGRDILRFRTQASGQPSEPLVIADPDFDLSSEVSRASPSLPAPVGRQSRELDLQTMHFSRLSGTRVEGERIAEMLGVAAWFEGTALEARLKAHKSPRILHLATHGFFLPDQKRDPERSAGLRGSGAAMENPLLRSGLALAGANTARRQGSLPPEAEDGILTAEDVSGMDLLNTELVVLSACETGLGQVRIGEGVFGLRRSFVLAGARGLLMSLWKVPDQQTQELMEDFYRRIFDVGLIQSRAEALRAAQLALKEKYPDPGYWGAFIYQGDPFPTAGRS
jgi:CHAT domain-containing protein